VNRDTDATPCFSRGSEATIAVVAGAAGAARYRIDVLQGTRRIARRTTTKTRLRLARVPATPLRIQVRAIGPDGIASNPRTTTIRRMR